MAPTRELLVRAWDSSQNGQPQELTWNVLGLMNNCWYRVKMHPHVDEQVGRACCINDKCSHSCVCVRADTANRGPDIENGLDEPCLVYCRAEALLRAGTLLPGIAAEDNSNVVWAGSCMNLQRHMHNMHKTRKL